MPATGYHSTVLESNILMQLNIHHACTSLEQCISEAHQEEQLAPTESLLCPLTLACETTFRTTAVERLPHKLLIQLKRFTLHGKNNTAAKIPRLIALHSATHIIYCDDASVRNISWATADQLLQQAYILAYAQLPLSQA